MSDQQPAAGATHCLEEVFLAPEFGRAQPVARATSPVAPPPVEVRAPEGVVVLFDRARSGSRAIAVVSGVAAAALAVAGLAVSSGRSVTPPTVSALGAPGSLPGHSTGASGPTGAEDGPPVLPADTFTTGGLTVTPASEVVPTSGSGPPPAAPPGVVATLPPGIAVIVVPTSPQAPSGPGGSPTPASSVTVVPTSPLQAPSAPRDSPRPPLPPEAAPSGSTGNVLAPVVSVVGNAVSTAGTTVSEVSGQLGQTVPALAPATHALGGVGSMISAVGNAARATGALT